MLFDASTNAFKRLSYTPSELFQLGIDAMLPQWSTDVIPI